MMPAWNPILEKVQSAEAAGRRVRRGPALDPRPRRHDGRPCDWWRAEFDAGDEDRDWVEFRATEEEAKGMLDEARRYLRNAGPDERMRELARRIGAGEHELAQELADLVAASGPRLDASTPLRNVVSLRTWTVLSRSSRGVPLETVADLAQFERRDFEYSLRVGPKAIRELESALRGAGLTWRRPAASRADARLVQFQCDREGHLFYYQHTTYGAEAAIRRCPACGSTRLSLTGREYPAVDEDARLRPR